MVARNGKSIMIFVRLPLCDDGRQRRVDNCFEASFHGKSVAFVLFRCKKTGLENFGLRFLYHFSGKVIWILPFLWDICTGKMKIICHRN